MLEETPVRSTKRDKGGACHAAGVSLRVTPKQVKTIDAYFHAGVRLYNSAQEEVLYRARKARQDPGFELVKQMPQGNGRTAGFTSLDDRHGFTRTGLQSHLNTLAKSYPRVDRYAHEMRELSDQAFEAVSRWCYGRDGRPWSEPTRRGLHSMSSKDRHSALQPVREQQEKRTRIEGLIAEDCYRYTRLARNTVHARWVSEAQIAFDGHAPLRNLVEVGRMGVDLGPSLAHWVTEDGPGQHDVLALGIAYPRAHIRRLSRWTGR